MVLKSFVGPGFVLNIFLLLVASCSGDVEYYPPSQESFLEQKREIENSFAQMSSEDLKDLLKYPLAKDPMVFRQSDYQTLINECNKRIKAFRLFLNDVYSDHRQYQTIPNINDIFADIALQNGFWDGKKELNLQNIFNDFLPHPLDKQSYIYSCDIMKTRKSNDEFEYFVVEDTITAAVGGLAELPELHYNLQQKVPGLMKYRQFDNIKVSIEQFISSLKTQIKSIAYPSMIVLSYHSPSEQFFKIFKDNGFQNVSLFGKDLSSLGNPNLLVNTAYYDSFDLKANEATFYHNLLSLVNRDTEYYLTEAKFINEIMDNNLFKKERQIIDENNFLIGHSASVKRGDSHVVSPLGSTSMFDHKLFGIILDKLIELYLGEKPKIANSETNFFFSYAQKKFNQELFDNVFVSGNKDAWVIKKTLGLGGKGVFILKTLNSVELDDLKNIIKQYPNYFIAQPLKELDIHKNLIYEIRIIAFSTPNAITFYPMPYLRGTPAGKTYKTNVTSGGQVIPSFVIVDK